MASVFSNQLKAILVLEDITEEGVSVFQSNSFTVQQFSYHCKRQRDAAGVPFGNTLPSYLDFSVRITSEESGKEFFRRMVSNNNFPYSFIFNASFNQARRLSTWEDAMVATGYLTEAEEVYEKGNGKDASQEQMQIRARLLLSNIAYCGREKVFKLTITND